MNCKYMIFVRVDCETLIPCAVYNYYAAAECALRERLDRYCDAGYIVKIQPDCTVAVRRFKVDDEKGFIQVPFTCPQGYNPLEWL